MRLGFVEDACLAWFAGLRYTLLHGPGLRADLAYKGTEGDEVGVIAEMGRGASEA